MCCLNFRAMESEMECISISHKTANSADRQRCYISKEDAARFLEEVMGLKQVEQCVVLSTCNRMEIYEIGRASCRERVSSCV